MPNRSRGLRAGSVILPPGGVMDWHSTRRREELLIALSGTVRVETDRPPRGRGISLRQGHVLLLPSGTWHRVLNRSGKRARYLYVTGAA